jgi:hypothetical protein
MKALAAIFLSLTLPGVHFAPRARTTPVETAKTHAARRGGVWYFADNGHAVYCYGPVMYVQDVQGGLTRVATFCQGDKTIVPLKD